MEKQGNFVTIKELDSTGWAKLHRGYKVDGKAKERVFVYQVPLALQSPDQFPHHLAVLDVLHHEMAGGKFLFGHKYLSGFPLSMVLKRCDRDGFPLPLDHALLIMERVLSGWEDYKLGLPHPLLIWMTFDGEVKCSPLPLSKAFPRWKHEELLPWLSPQVAAGAEWGRSDQVWAAGALFFQLLTGQVLPAGGSDDARVGAILKTPAMAEGPIPKDLQMILLKALASKTEERYQHIKDMREELGHLIYSGAYTPTTFNLAFFMHTLFREESDGEEKLLEKEDALDLTPVLAPPPPPKPAAPEPAAQPAPARSTPSFAQAPAPEAEEKKSPVLFIALGTVAVVAIIAGIFFFKGGSEPPAAPATSAADNQALQELSAKLRESELKMQEMEAAAAKNKEEMEKLQKAQNEGQKSPEIDKAIEQKRKEQEAIAAKLKEAEQAKKAIQQQTQTAPPVAAPAPPATGGGTPAAPTGAAPATAAAPQPSPAAGPPPAPVDTAAKPDPAPVEPVPAKPVSSVKEGDLVSLSEVDSSPVPTQKVQPSYPPIAKMKKITGKVTLKVLVNEKGKPDQVEVVTISPPSNVGFDKAAIEAVRQWSFQPATKDGTRVKCWFLVPVVFE